MTRLKQHLKGPVYQAYSYSYPHKSAYRSFEQPVDLQPLWQQENRQALFLYLHIPFCEMRCGFCNLFSLSRPQQELVNHFLAALSRQMEVMDQVLGERQFARLALGGGTPSFLSVPELQKLFVMLENKLAVNFATTPTSIEVSPATIDSDKIALMENYQFKRISIGIQSFAQAELKLLARRQKEQTIHQALTLISESQIAILNIDLIYGIPGQSPQSWLHSLKTALTYQPQEIYIYPLYMRPNTGLGKLHQVDATLNNNLVLNEDMLKLYRLGRDFLLEHGYQQLSMRMFSKHQNQAQPDSEPEYSCQKDGMVGLGPGARSYTLKRHYSSRYATHYHSVKDIIVHYSQQTHRDFSQTDYGYELSLAEQHRRHIMQSLFLLEGLSKQVFYQRFGIAVEECFPQLHELLELQLAEETADKIRLNDRGIELADSLAPWLASEEVLNKMHTTA